MTAAYDCTVNLGEYDDLTAVDLDAVTTALDKERYEWYLDEDTLTIQGDQSVVDKDSFTYVDNGGNVQKREEVYLPEEEETATYDAETGELIEEATEAQS